MPVVVAPGRSARPGALGRTTRIADAAQCPFCEGHEAMTPPEVLSFRRGERLVCLANLSARAVSLPPHERVILASGPLTGGMLPPDTAVWLHTVH